MSQPYLRITFISNFQYTFSIKQVNHIELYHSELIYTEHGGNTE